MGDGDGVLFEIEPRPYIPEWRGNDRAPPEDQLVVWYRPFPQREQRQYRRLALEIRQLGVRLEDLAVTDEAYQEVVDEIVEKTDALADEALRRAVRLVRGTPGAGGVGTTDPDEIARTLRQDDDLLSEVAIAISTGALSAPDEVYSGRLSAGQPADSPERS